MIIDSHCHLDLLVEKLRGNLHDPFFSNKDFLQLVHVEQGLSAFQKQSHSMQKIYEDSLILSKNKSTLGEELNQEEALSKWTEKTVLDAILLEAKKTEIECLLTVSVDLENIAKIQKIAEDYPSFVFSSVGVHPNESMPETVNQIEKMVIAAGHSSVIAIGETGLDYYYETTERKIQQKAFMAHIEVAHSVNKPLIIHSRSAVEDTFTIIRNSNAEKVGGVFHCFTEDMHAANLALECGFYISFSGIITFNKSADLQKIASVIPLDRLLIETDSPYLAPVPYRGKINRPAYVKEVAKKIAELRGITYQEVASATTANFYRLFNL